MLQSWQTSIACHRFRNLLGFQLHTGPPHSWCRKHCHFGIGILFPWRSVASFDDALFHAHHVWSSTEAMLLCFANWVYCGIYWVQSIDLTIEPEYVVRHFRNCAAFSSEWNGLSVKHNSLWNLRDLKNSTHDWIPWTTSVWHVWQACLARFTTVS